MYLLLIGVFVIGYACIALEHSIKIDKAASALITGVLVWTLLSLGGHSLFPDEANVHSMLDKSILHHIGEIGAILFFLLAAMTIVELIDAHDGFDVITSRIKTLNKVKLLWIIGWVTFFLSSVLDNLTTAIVMAALLKKLINSKTDLAFFGGIVIIAANAGGAWSPIGDVTTIMLWIGGQLTTLNVMKVVFLPSIICLLVPLIVLTFIQKGEVVKPKSEEGAGHSHKIPEFEKKLVFGLGVAGLLFVPVFKSLTHLPPFLGMLLSLGVLWVVTELMHLKKDDETRKGLSVNKILTKIDTPSVLFFLGILTAVAGLQTSGHLRDMAGFLDQSIGNIFAINFVIGLLSSVIDNVPLVAGAMGMYSLDQFGTDNRFWHLLAYCAGTGGSCLIIGSAAGVAIMGLLKIDFIWYLKNVSWIALLGYVAGALVFLVI